MADTNQGSSKPNPATISNQGCRSAFPNKSNLLQTTQTREVFCFNIIKSCSASASEQLPISNKYIVAPAFSTCENVRAMPSCSITSVASRIPAVSINRNIKPSKFSCASMASRVVPAISLTIALSSFNNALNNVLFPAFGRPANTNANPFLITLPKANESRSDTTSV